jgi:23S rRNA (guanine745-N1)-methyltransferase
MKLYSMHRQRFIEDEADLLLTFLGRPPAWTAIGVKNRFDGKLGILGCDLNGRDLAQIHPVRARSRLSSRPLRTGNSLSHVPILSQPALNYTYRMLLCPVRDCHMELAREIGKEKAGRLMCPRGHSFDVARSGYINLLQPQERRSKKPGDTRAAAAARRRLHEGGVTEPLLRAIAEMMSASPADIVLDAGCGDGFYLGSLARLAGFDAHGVDISTPAVEAAARRYPGCEWIVANADRFLPYSDSSFSVVLSITARMNSGEFRRVLRADGRLLVALPAPEDLVELRGAGRDRVARTIETFEHDFTLADRRRVTTSADLDAAAVSDVLLSIYRPMRTQPAEAMRVTFSLDLLLFRPK